MQSTGCANTVRFFPTYSTKNMTMTGSYYSAMEDDRYQLHKHPEVIGCPHCYESMLYGEL